MKDWGRLLKRIYYILVGINVIYTVIFCFQVTACIPINLILPALPWILIFFPLLMIPFAGIPLIVFLIWLNGYLLGRLGSWLQKRFQPPIEKIQ